MRLELGRPVHGSDGPVGELADVVIDPTSRRVTHLVVEPHHRHGGARLVPAELARADGGPDRELSLRCTADELSRLPLVQEFAYLRFGELPADDPDWDVGIETVLVSPSYDYTSFGSNPMDLDPHVAIAYDRVPKGEAEIRRPSGVVSADGHRLGHVDGFLLDGDERITHLVLERGHLFGRREVTIPIDAVARVATDAVTLALTKDEVARLRSVSARRWRERRRDDEGRGDTKAA